MAVGSLALALPARPLSSWVVLVWVLDHALGEGLDLGIAFLRRQLARLDFEHVADGDFGYEVLRRILRKCLHAQQAASNRDRRYKAFHLALLGFLSSQATLNRFVPTARGIRLACRACPHDGTRRLIARELSASRHRR
jgi:hypothetical protein